MPNHAAGDEADYRTENNIGASSSCCLLVQGLPPFDLRKPCCFSAKIAATQLGIYNSQILDKWISFTAEMPLIESSFGPKAKTASSRRSRLA